MAGKKAIDAIINKEDLKAKLYKHNVISDTAALTNISREITNSFHHFVQYPFPQHRVGSYSSMFLNFGHFSASLVQGRS